MWFAVNTKPRNENLAKQSIEEKGVEVFLPRFETSRRRGGKRVLTVEPLFPGYLFVSTGEGEGEKSPVDVLIAIRWVPGVKRVLCSGLSPVQVPDEAINLIRWRIGEGGPGVPKVEREFREGDSVAVRHGPFKGLIGVVDRTIPAKDRVRVFLDFMSHQTPVELDSVLLDRLS
ncbi:MAG: transcription termination/antitermination NusG family protein [Candidatus Eremiobacteraeota bacterium]|nr:transcription termination/antitermination NusG family protein [Candidatus Eremiobacteraeota bacterium]